MTRAAVPRVPLFRFKYILTSSVIFRNRRTGTRNLFFFYMYVYSKTIMSVKSVLK